jgi:hypothetical protein
VVSNRPPAAFEAGHERADSGGARHSPLDVVVATATIFLTDLGGLITGTDPHGLIDDPGAAEPGLKWHRRVGLRPSPLGLEAARHSQRLRVDGSGGPAQASPGPNARPLPTVWPGH